MGPSNIPVLFRKTAMGLCGAFYEGNRSPEFRKHWKKLFEDQRSLGNSKFKASGPQDYYIQLNWPSWVVTAKDTLLAMLQLPENQVSQQAKDEIYDTFTKDIERRSMELPPSEVIH